jgi:hypothetical protein
MKPLYTSGIETTAHLQQLVADDLWLQEQYQHILLPPEAAQLDDVDGLRDRRVASAAIVLPSTQQRLTVQNLRRLNRSMFIICWCDQSSKLCFAQIAVLPGLTVPS